MAVGILDNCAIYLGGLDLSCQSNSVDLGLSAPALDVRTFCTEGWVELIGGRKTADAKVHGLAKFDLTALDAVLTPVIGSRLPISFAAKGNTVGNVSYATYGEILSYVPLMGNLDGLAEFDLAIKSSTAVARGALLHDQTSRASSGNGTSVQIGAIPAGLRMWVALHVLSGTGTLTVKVQSDNATGFPSPVDQLTLSAATGVGSQWGSIVGPVTDDWWRVVYTISGGPFVFTCTAGLSAP